jgi:hypothetical protein
VSWSPIPSFNYTNSTTVLFLPRIIERRSPREDPVSKTAKQAQAALSLKEKKLPAFSQNRIMNFSLAPSKQADSSFLSRAPAEIRNEIYTLCGFKDRRIHLYELQDGVKGFNCEDYDLSQPCLGSAPCRPIVGQINPMFPEHNKISPLCPATSQCAPIGVLALSLTCQLVHNETFGLVYASNMFVISKYVFGSILEGNVLHKQKGLSAPLARIRRLQLDLGLAKYGSLPMVQSKHATLRSVKEHAADLQELCVTFTTCLQGLLRNPIDDKSLVLLSRFRGLTSFKLVVKNARDTDQQSERRVNEKQDEFTRAVPYIEDILEKFVSLTDMDDTTGLDELEKQMLKDTRFVSGLKKKVKAMLAEE